MNKNITIPISVFYIFTLLIPVIIGIVTSDFSFFFLLLVFLLTVWIFLSIVLLLFSAIYLFFIKNNQDKKILLLKNIKKYFWLLILNCGLLIIIQLIFHPVTKTSSSGIPMKLEKPVIYLYPQSVTNVSVKVDYQPGFLATYPSYNDGWDVIAYPDGKLVNQQDGKEYSYLYWEGKQNNSSYDLTRGFVVKGQDTALFLQDKLTQIGLNPKEYNEFIIYWLPQMIDNPYNLIHFATSEEYDKKIPLDISPTPDSILRVFMVFKPLTKFIDIKLQSFTPFIRNGFTVVEWGGSRLE